MDARLQELLDNGEISGKISKTVEREMEQTGETADQVISRLGLVHMDDTTGIRRFIYEYVRRPANLGITHNQMFNGIVKELKGRANPVVIQQILRDDKEIWKNGPSFLG